MDIKTFLKKLSQDVKEFEITPELAEEILLLNKMNRSIRYGIVERLKVDIINGYWINNAFDTIKFLKENDEYFLVDGQHRLLAIQKSTKNIKINCCIIKKEAIPIIDSNATRRICDVLAIEKNINSRYASVISSALIHYDGFLDNKITETNQYSRKEILKLYDQYPEISNIFLKYSNVFFKATEIHIKIGLMVAFIQFASLKSETDSELFLKKLILGIDLLEISPIYQCRKLLKDLTNNNRLRTSNYKLSSNLLYKILANTWNRFRKHEKIIKRYSILLNGEGFIELI